MKHIALLFLLFATAAYAEDTSETNAVLMDVANFPSRTYAGICGYGKYHNPDKKSPDQCITRAQWVDKSPNCSAITINNVSYSTYTVDIDVSSFMYPEPSGNCRGLYSAYIYNPDLMIPVESGGAYLYTVTNYAGICGYRQYHLNGTCYNIDKLTPENRFGCDVGYHKSVATDASFMGPKEFVTNDQEPLCNGDYLLYNFVKGTYSTSLDASRIYPLYNGTLLFVGADVIKVSTFDDMRNNRCTVNPDKYYNFSLLGETTSQPFAFPKLAMCDDGFSKFNARQNCHYIKTDADVADNWLCAVLCERPEYVYTNSGVCSVDGYCTNGDKKLRLHVARPEGAKYDYPLYASKTSSPSMHFKFLNTSGAEQTCYVNLVPPQAIDHFVGTKPNPIRVGKSLSWTDSSGKTHTTDNLITID